MITPASRTGIVIDEADIELLATGAAYAVTGISADPPRSELGAAIGVSLIHGVRKALGAAFIDAVGSVLALLLQDQLRAMTDVPMPADVLRRHLDWPMRTDILLPYKVEEQQCEH